MFFYAEPDDNSQSQIYVPQAWLTLTLTSSTNSLNLESACIGASSQATFVLSAGSSSNIISQETVTLSDDSDQFSFSPSTFMMIPGVTNQTITVTFTPTSWGIKTGSITATAAGGSSKTINLSAVCVANPLIITSSVGTVNFGSTYVNETSSATFTVSAGGRVQDIVLLSDNSDQFDFSPTSFSMTGANQIQTVTVYFTPTSNGSKLGLLTLSASGGDVAHVSLTGSAAYRAFILTSSVDSIAFTNTLINATSSQTFTVSAGGIGGTETITVTDNSDQFDYSPSTFSLTGGGSSQTVTAKFTPTTAGSKSATLTLSASGGDTKLIGLAGVASEQYYSSVSLLLNGQTTGSTFLDSSQNNFTVSKYGGATASTFGAFNKEDGKWGAYMPAQTATNAYGDVLKNSLMVNGTSTSARLGTNFTLEFWFSGSNLSTRNMAVCKTALNTNSSDDWLSAIDTTTGKFSFAIDYNGTGYKYFTSTRSVTGSGWHHLAAVKQGTTYKLFIDGALDYTEVFSGVTLNAGTNNVTIGGSTMNPGTQGDYGRTDCAYSNVRITNTAVYTASFTPSTEPLTAISGTVLLTCQDKTFKDNGPNNYSVTVQRGAPMVKDVSPFANTTPVTGNSIYFNGTSSYLTVPDNNQFTFDGDFCVEGWVYPNSPPGTSQTIIAQWPGAVATNCSFGVSIFNGKLYTVRGIGSSNLGTAGTLSVPTNAWTHIAVLRTGTNLKLYVNGVLDNMITVSGAYNNSTSVLTVGYANPTDRQYFNGYVDDLRITKGIARYQGDPPSQQLPDTAVTDPYYSNVSVLLHGNGSSYIDSGPNSLQIAASTGTGLDSISGKFDGAMMFNGSNGYVSLGTQITSSLFDLGTGSFTIEGWIKPNSVASGKTIYGNYGRTLTNGYRSGAHILRILNNKLDFYVYPTGDLLLSNSTISTGSWTHVALVKSGSTTNMFINGVLDSSYAGAYTLTSDPLHVPTVGAFWQTTSSIEVNSWFDGLIDDFRITKGVARYTANFTPPGSL